MEILLRTLQVQDTLRSSLRAGLFISAARRAFFRPREDLRRVGERFSGGWGGGGGKWLDPFQKPSPAHVATATYFAQGQETLKLKH